jgi:hypothetical protein
MNLSELERIKESLSQLSAEDQDHVAGFLLVERLKRNSLVMPSLHKRVEDSDPENWQTLKSIKASPDND